MTNDKESQYEKNDQKAESVEKELSEVAKVQVANDGNNESATSKSRSPLINNADPVKKSDFDADWSLQNFLDASTIIDDNNHLRYK